MKEKSLQFLENKFNLVFFGILILLLGLSCFVNWGVFIVIAFVVICSFFLNITNIIATMLFMVSFLVCFSIGDENFWEYIYLYLVLLLCIKYIIFLLKSEEKESFKQGIIIILKKINWKLLIPIIVLFVYWLLPFHSNSFGSVVGNILDFIVLYLAYEMRKEINFSYLIQMFCLGIVVSSLISLMQPISTRLQEIMIQVPPVNNYTRFTGLTTHPNQFAIFSFIALSALLFLKYHNKISYINFYGLFAIVFIFGYCSISRGFIIAFVISLLIFVLAYIVKYKKRALKVLAVVSCLLVVLGGIFTVETKMNFERLYNITENVVSNYGIDNNSVQENEKNIDIGTAENEYIKFSEEWWDAVYDGQIRYDPGRVEIWKEYIEDWASSTKTILLGQGFSQPYIGCMAPHNLYLLLLWRDGLIGVLIQCFILLSFINYKKVKEVKKYWVVLMLLIPYLCSCLLESGFMFFKLIFVLGCVYCFANENKKDSVMIVTSGVLPVPAVNGGAVETLTQSLIDQNEIYRKEKFEVVSIYDEKAKKESTAYNYTKFSFYKPNKIIILLDKCIYSFVKNVLHKQKTITYRNLLQRLCYTHYVSEMIRDSNYKSIVIENFSSLYLELKLYDNDLKYKDRYFYHLHNEVSGTFGCRSVMQKTKNILCVSAFIKKSIIKTLNLNENADNVSVLKNCIDISKFNGNITDEERNKLLLKYNIPKDKSIIIFTGRLTKEKGIDILLKAVRDVERQDFVLLIVGAYFFDTTVNSKFEEDLNKLKNDLGEKVIFTGFVNYSELPKLYAIADFAVLPSMWEEPAGLTILEATASGLPLITTNSGGIIEYCNIPNAVILEKDENIHKNLTKEIDKMVDNAKRVDNTEFVKSFSLLNYYENFIKMIKE